MHSLRRWTFTVKFTGWIHRNVPVQTQVYRFEFETLLLKLPIVTSKVEALNSVGPLGSLFDRQSNLRLKFEAQILSSRFPTAVTLPDFANVTLLWNTFIIKANFVGERLLPYTVTIGMAACPFGKLYLLNPVCLTHKQYADLKVLSPNFWHPDSCSDAF